MKFTRCKIVKLIVDEIVENFYWIIIWIISLYIYCISDVEGLGWNFSNLKFIRNCETMKLIVDEIVKLIVDEIVKFVHIQLWIFFPIKFGKFMYIQFLVWHLWNGLSQIFEILSIC